MLVFDALSAELDVRRTRGELRDGARDIFCTILLAAGEHICIETVFVICEVR